ncbi:hypothetical protein L211DRAFT_899889 [Terfezia boudieri ATCC MYA-4762]|uniref:Uncharacterized protein n=1 Tax=Terfezia boudieri ATCC MYA-4762 TaxID=1051890 RepID=A0A3N4LUN2_9PEZI|nr:hypothetical protein L211DRAFT_899889 [Terfezia boudieri ATCC MYA-4762]
MHYNTCPWLSTGLFTFLPYYSTIHFDVRNSSIRQYAAPERQLEFRPPNLWNLLLVEHNKPFIGTHVILHISFVAWHMRLGLSRTYEHIILEDGELPLPLLPVSSYALGPLCLKFEPHSTEDNNDNDNDIDNDNNKKEASPAMPTKLPKAKDIVLKEVRDFDGSPSSLSLFDTQIQNALKRLDIPVYFAAQLWATRTTHSKTKPNYKLGENPCSGISNKFTGAAAQWWDDYDTKPGSLSPNCWKKAANAAQVPP